MKQTCAMQRQIIILHNYFSCNTDVMADVVELGIIKGIDYKVANPKTVDTYVKYEVPYPSVRVILINVDSLID